MARLFTGTIGYCFLFCKIDKTDEANTAYGPVDFDTGGDRTFGALMGDLFAPATDPPTHRGAATVIDAQMDLDIKAATPTITRYFSADGWTWETALADMSLQLHDDGSIS